jgi:hypothetical protein
MDKIIGAIASAILLPGVFIGGVVMGTILGGDDCETTIVDAVQRDYESVNYDGEPLTQLEVAQVVACLEERR